MAHSAWEAAADWSSPNSYRRITRLAQLQQLKIRELKQLAAAINRDCGTVITASLALKLSITVKGKGRTLGQMRKAELVQCIWYVRHTMLSKPLTVGEWKFNRLSDRVYSFTTPDGEVWCNYVGFSSEQEAFKQYQWAMQTGKCHLASYRKRDRTHSEWEVKYWRLSPKTVAAMLKKDAPAPNLELEQKIDYYNRLLDNGSDVAKAYVERQLRENPSLGLEIDTASNRVKELAF